MTATQAHPASTPTLAQSQAFCRALTRKQARNFYYGLKLLPEPKRTAMYALYAYMRLVDDIADDDSSHSTLDQRRQNLDRWQNLTHEACALQPSSSSVQPFPELWPAFIDMVRRYRPPEKVFSDMIAGQRQDLDPLSLPDFPALHQYCYRVASVVGVASLYVFGFDGGDDTLALGVDRGIAFQLTNILRDLREDAAPPRQRCYLPADELARFSVTPAALASARAEPGFLDLMHFQIARARDFYARSAPLESRVHPDARPTLAAMTAIYRGILEKIAAHPQAVLTSRIRLTTWSKLLIAWRAMRLKSASP